MTEIIGTAPESLEHIPGSGRVITQKDLWENHRLTVNEALREVPGVNVRDEEGLGLRPNIGIRGLDPTRSRKVHIMEDGVPIMLMPYGDPSAYYFPPLFRFDRIEVLKGSGQLLYGPQTIGGVMNFITRMPPAVPQGNLEVRGGNLNYFNTHFDYGGTWGKSGYLADITHFQSDSPRFTNNRVTVDDVTFKAVQELTERTTLLTKFNYYSEESKLGYQGLTEAEWGAMQAVIGTHRSPMTNWILSVWACMWLCNTCSMPTSRRRQISSVIGLNEIGNGHSSKELTRMEIQLVVPFQEIIFLPRPLASCPRQISVLPTRANISYMVWSRDFI